MTRAFFKTALKTAKKVIGIVVFTLVTVALLLYVAAAVFNRNERKPVFVFGYSVLWVQTGSMEGAIPERSCILVKRSDGKDLTTGTIITFWCTDPASAVYGSTITHRIVGKTAEGYETKGDNALPDTRVVLEEEVVAVHVKNLPTLTVFTRIFSSPFGLALIAAVFLGSCAFLYIPDLIAALKDDEKSQRKKAEKEQEEREKEIERRVREEVRKMQERDRNGGNE